MKIIIETSGVESKKLSLTDTFDYQAKRAQINKEINSNKIEIDRTVFRKSILEKKDLKEAKKDYLLTVNTSKYEEEAIKTRNYIAKNPLDCGNLTLTIKK